MARSELMSLRRKTGCLITDCRAALVLADGDEEKALEILLAQGTGPSRGPLAMRAEIHDLKNRVGVLERLLAKVLP